TNHVRYPKLSDFSGMGRDMMIFSTPLPRAAAVTTNSPMLIAIVSVQKIIMSRPIPLKSLRWGYRT
ncbi:MAG: hypothetical protein AAFR60_09105, partial [Pseudomonadota bacterium]